MADELKLDRKQIQISEGRTMNIYTFELDGKPMPEMSPADVVPNLHPEPPEKPQG